MTYLVWEKQLLGYLKNQTAEDKKQIIDYYREMYYDKIERGESPDSVIYEFGDPADCAAKILAEHDSNSSEAKLNFRAEPELKQTQKKSKVAQSHKEHSKRLTVGGVIGWFFTTVLLLIPLGACAVSLVASFAAGAISGFAVMLAGAILAVGSPICLFFGWNVALMIAGIGCGICAIGVGAILAVVFWLLTKYTATGLYKAALIFIKGRA